MGILFCMILNDCKVKSIYLFGPLCNAWAVRTSLKRDRMSRRSVNLDDFSLHNLSKATNKLRVPIY